jgi:hypothetical protein
MKMLSFLNRTKALIAFTLTFLLLSAGIHAQTISPNVKVNNSTAKDAATEGDRCIDVVDDVIYTVYSDERTGTDIRNIYFSKSTDGGETFSAGVSLNTSIATEQNIWPSIAVSSTGVIYVAWNFVEEVVIGKGVEYYYDVFFSKSTDGGTSFSTPVAITNTHSFVFPCIGVSGSNVHIFYADAAAYPLADYYLVSSADGGDNFGSPVQVNDGACVEDIEKYESLTALAMDGSGNIYLAWLDGRRTDGNGDIFFAKSTDHGTTIGTNVMVNDVSVPENANAIQYKPRITAGGTNKVYVSFIDLRLGTEWDDNRAYLSVSSDGGANFATEVSPHDHTCYHHNLMANSDGKLSAVISTFMDTHWGLWLVESDDDGTTWNTPVAFTGVLDEDGEDPHIFLDADGYAYAVWSDDRSGNFEVYSSRVTILSGTNSEIFSDSEISIYPNPAGDRFTIDLGMNCRNISMEILNTQGQTVYNQQYYNTQEINVDAGLSPGIYILKIIADGRISALKLVKNSE